MTTAPDRQPAPPSPASSPSPPSPSPSPSSSAFPPGTWPTADPPAPPVGVPPASGDAPDAADATHPTDRTSPADTVGTADTTETRDTGRSTPPRPTVVAAVAVRPTATLRAATAPSRAEMAERPAVLTVLPWDDALLDQFGHDPRSPYVERFWLGILGPSATWMLRAFAHRFDAEPEGFSLDLRDTARSLGIGARGGANGALYRTLERIMAFGFAQFTDESTLVVRRRMGPLNRRQQQRLTAGLQHEHDQWVAARPATTTTSVDDMRRRARALALSLLELGEDLEATEHQLHRWRFHPAVAFDATRWAATVHEHRRANGPAGPVDGSPDQLAGGDAA